MTTVQTCTVYPFVLSLGPFPLQPCVGAGSPARTMWVSVPQAESCTAYHPPAAAPPLAAPAAGATPAVAIPLLCFRTGGNGSLLAPSIVPGAVPGGEGGGLRSPMDVHRA